MSLFLDRNFCSLYGLHLNIPTLFVLCHSDIHGGNILIADTGELYVVDWDDPILAPKERDLMFIGGGSASTAGGIKVSTFALLGFVMWAEARGDPDVAAFGRRVGGALTSATPGASEPGAAP